MDFGSVGHLGYVYSRFKVFMDFCTDLTADFSGALNLLIVFFISKNRFFSTWLNPVWKYTSILIRYFLKWKQIAMMCKYWRNSFKHIYNIFKIVIHFGYEKQLYKNVQQFNGSKGISTKGWKVWDPLVKKYNSIVKKRTWHLAFSWLE